VGFEVDVGVALMRHGNGVGKSHHVYEASKSLSDTNEHVLSERVTQQLPYGIVSLVTS